MGSEHWNKEREWMQQLSHGLGFNPVVETNIKGVRDYCHVLEKYLIQAGFIVERIANKSTADDGTATGADILFCTRAPAPMYDEAGFIGLLNHYDIEDWKAAEWNTHPVTPEIQSNRVYCRGVGDNLGPLLLRIMALRDAPSTRGIVWLIHGEEEIGSPFAHEIYPQILKDKPDVIQKVALWIDETGYFERDGRQRIIANHLDSNPSFMTQVIQTLETTCQQHGLTSHVQHRYLTKAFGADRCPCLKHVIDGRVPYLAIGPNDVDTNIHRPNESIPLDYLAISEAQFVAVLTLPASCE